jgi:DNA-binding NtrC family response regulator
MNDAKPLLLIVDDERPVRMLLKALAQREGFDAIECATGAEGIDVLRRRHVDLMFLDLHMPEVNGLDVLQSTRDISGATHIVLITGAGSIESAVEAVKLGAEDYLQKPLNVPRLTETMRSVRQQFEQRASVLDSDTALAARLEFCGMIGRSSVMNRLFDLIRRLAPHARSVLVTGETGCGKELVARALHRLGPRKDKPFITVNCSAIVETLFESELFGHLRGAFTGATENKAGLFEAAGGGTLFLDEVGELPLAVQSKLLRVLETGEVQRVGSVQGTKLDVRIIAATNRDLEAGIRAATFRSDLYYRLNVVEIAVPPLRDRPEDVPYLTAAFVRQYSAAFEKGISGLTPPAEAILMHAPWPGNVRQLRNVIERACLLSEGALLGEGDIQQALGNRAASTLSSDEAESDDAPPPSKEAVIEALRKAAGNKASAARLLNISRRALYRLIEKHRLEGGSESSFTG